LALHGAKDKNMNNRHKAIGLLLVFGSILVLLASWNLPEKPAPQIVR
jgi:hypothetical protein